jgi:spermidine/putrescine transport system ATP-binding protein
VIDVSFSGVSTQYLVDIAGLGTVVVFAQNLASGPGTGFGDLVWVSWDASHTFVLADEPPADGRFADDTDTQAVAAQAKERLLSELEEA